MAGRQPDFAFQAKSKKTGTRLKFGAAWRNERGINMRLERGWKLVGPGGVEVDDESAFLNIYDNSSNDNNRDTGKQPALAADFGDEEAPF